MSRVHPASDHLLKKLHPATSRRASFGGHEDLTEISDIAIGLRGKAKLKKPVQVSSKDGIVRTIASRQKDHGDNDVADTVLSENNGWVFIGKVSALILVVCVLISLILDGLYK